MKKLLIVLALVLSGCGGAQAVVIQTPTPIAPNNCDITQVQTTNMQLQKLLARWDDAVKVADSTGRGSLSGPLGNMQSIKRDASDLAVPECLSLAKQHLVDSMNATIDGYLAFMSQSPDAEVKSHFTYSTTALNAYIDELARVIACAPNCN